MLANIVVLSGSVLPIRLEARVRHVLLVDAPADTLGLEEVDNVLDACAETAEVVVGDSVGAGTRGSHVVGLRGVGGGIVVGQADALASEPSEVAYK